MEFIKRIRRLSLALMISGALNIGILSFFLYWVLRERPPTPYCELKPASLEQQQISFADCRECQDVLKELSQQSYFKLIDKLSDTHHIENGLAERDLALAYLISFYHFDMQRALPKQTQPRQKRLIGWKPKSQEEPVLLSVFPDLTDNQFRRIIEFAKKERWPFTPEGLFILLKMGKKENSIDTHLAETFFKTSEFWTVELLFKPVEQEISRKEILNLLLEGDWQFLSQFAVQQRKLNDQSVARRQKFLLDYLSKGSSVAASLLLKLDAEFARKKLDDEQVIALLNQMAAGRPESERFAKEMLVSPRSAAVWQHAGKFLYQQTGEEMPVPWNYQMVLDHFITGSKIDEPLPKLKSITASPKETSHYDPLKKEGLFSQKPVFQSSATKQVPPKLYVVQEGDSLWKIARKFNITVDKIKESNHLESDKIKPGMTLIVN